MPEICMHCKWGKEQGEGCSKWVVDGRGMEYAAFANHRVSPWALLAYHCSHLEVLLSGNSQDIIWLAYLSDISHYRLRSLQMKARTWLRWYIYPVGSPPYDTVELVEKIDSLMGHGSRGKWWKPLKSNRKGI